MLKGKEMEQMWRIQRRRPGHWFLDEIEELIKVALANKDKIAEICSCNDISLDKFFDWTQKFLSGGRDRLCNRISKREQDLLVKVEVQNQHIAELKRQIELKEVSQ